MKTQLPFVDRPPTLAEVERIRLILSTYQDGTGMLTTADGTTLPGWRDFERAVASALGGIARESKAIFDVVLSSPAEKDRPRYGLSCKMRRELNRIERDGSVTIEVSNAAGEFWDALEQLGVARANFFASAPKAGSALMDVVDGWHQDISVKNKGQFDIRRSSYLVLLWNRELQYQLFQFSLRLFDATKLKWSVPKSKKDSKKDSRRLCGYDGTGNCVEWYGLSDGQFKLYPFASQAVWTSARFQLEPLPEGIRPTVTKAASYFPEKWLAAT